MVERGEGGSVVLTSSRAGIRAYANTAHYTAAKHGVIGLMKVLAAGARPASDPRQRGLPHNRENAAGDQRRDLRAVRPHLENPTEDDVREPFEGLNILLGVGWIEPGDVSDSVLFLCSDDGEFITGIALPIDAGNTVR